MAFGADWLEKARITLFYENIGKTAEGQTKVRLNRTIKVTPYDNVSGYTHDTAYYTNLRLSHQFGDFDQAPYEMVIEAAPATLKEPADDVNGQRWVHRMPERTQV